MLPRPRSDLKPNTADFERFPLVKPTGFREYDARWLFPEEINLMGLTAVGLGMATLFDERGVKKRLVVGHDYRSYSASVKQALINGLLAGGCEVHDIGLALSPMAYFAQFDLDVEGVAMVTASHNDNGWTGIKMGMARPLTFGPDEMSRLKEIVLGGTYKTADGGRYIFVPDMAERYMKALTDRPKLKRPLKVIAACGNGTAGAFAPKVLEAIGCEVVPLDAELDYTFPRYNPNPEDMEMLHAIAAAVVKHKADVGLGFDGDGDRCGVVDNEGHEIFADTVGVMLARDISARFKNAVFVADVKSTGLFMTDPVLQANGAKALYWKTGHSYMKRYTFEQKALVGFEKSGHFFFQPPLGRGYDDGLVAGSGGMRHARARRGQDHGRPEARAAEDLSVADHVAALRRREEVRHRRQGGRALHRSSPPTAAPSPARRSAISSPSTACASRSRTAPGVWCAPHRTSRSSSSSSRARCRKPT